MRQLNLNLEFDEILDLEKIPNKHPLYPIVDNFIQAIKVAPHIKSLMYFKLKMERNEIVNAI